MRKELAILLLAAAVLVSGCTQQDQATPDPNEQPPSGDLEASAYDQIEQEMEEATGDIDLGGLEDELLV